MNIEAPTIPTQIASSTGSNRSMEAADSDSLMNNQANNNYRQDFFLSMPLWGGKKVDDDEISLFDDIHNQFSAIYIIDDNFAETQKVEKESQIRVEMTKLLEMCLRAQDNKCDMKPSQSKESIRKLASMLEDRLYKSAISFESYCDLQSLESRMRVVLFHLRNQRLRHKKKRSNITSQKRRQLLKQVMGLSQYAKAEWLVHEILQRKNLLAGQSCAKCHSSTAAPSLGEHLPTPVKDFCSFGLPFVIFLTSVLSNE